MEYSYLLIFTIVLALIFDFINGFHDAANSVATIVATRVLKPQWAVVWAAFFNFIAFIFFETKVASTIGKGVIDPTIVDVPLILAALSGAIVWNLVTWYWGLPSSSSHALIGGLAGAGMMKGGIGTLNQSGLTKICLSIVGSPVLGMIIGYLLMKMMRFLVQSFKPMQIDEWFRKLQLVSAALYSLGHGGNDAQKTMGIITVLLMSTGHLATTGAFHVPFWIVISCQIAMGLGTLFGGWKIVKTMGMKLTKLRPIGGFCAETSGAATLFLATSLGIPVSTTHTITGSIVGVGTAEARGVKWDVAGRIVWAWVFTLPASAIIAAASLYLLNSMTVTP